MQHVVRNDFLCLLVMFFAIVSGFSQFCLFFLCFFNRPGGQDRKQNSQNHKRTRTAYSYSRLSAHLIHGTRPSWWHSAQLLFSILPWTSSQLLFSIHPWTSYQLLFSIHPWTSSQCELNTPVGLRPSCELNTPVGLRPSCDLNTPFGLRPSCQLNTPVSVRLSYELNTPVGIRPSCANLQYTPLPFSINGTAEMNSFFPFYWGPQRQRSKRSPTDIAPSMLLPLAVWFITKTPNKKKQTTKGHET